jgi:radical SAM superfamily enzyme YgiQ (UPF0313 family)
MTLVLASFVAPTFSLTPFGCAALKASLLSGGNYLHKTEPEILSFAPHESVMRAADVLFARQPSIIGLSCYVWNYTSTIQLIDELRRRNLKCPIVLGGPQVAADDSRLLAMLLDERLTCAVTGDGELAIETILARELIPQNRISNPAEPVHNSATFQSIGSNKNSNVLSLPIEDVNTLPNPYRLVPELLSDVQRSGLALVEGSRGCAFGCTFCDQGWRKPRRRDLELVQDDLSFVYANGARRIIFLDPTFNFDRDRMTQLLYFLRAQLPSASISAEIKADCLGEPEIEALSWIRDTEVEVGLQSSNPATLHRIRRPTKLDILTCNIQRLNQLRVKVTINTIFGLPGETLGDWMDTVDFCYRMGPVHITSTCLKLLPNTEVWRTRADYGYCWDERNLFRATASNTMPGQDFLKASSMSVALKQLQAGTGTLPRGVRDTIDGRYNRRLSRYLYAKTHPYQRSFVPLFSAG